VKEKTYDNFFTADSVTLLVVAVLGTAVIVALLNGAASDSGAVFWVMPAILIFTLAFSVIDRNRYTLTESHLVVNGLVFRRSVALDRIDFIKYSPNLQYVKISVEGRYFIGFSTSWFYGLVEMLNEIQERSGCEVSPTLQTKLNQWKLDVQAYQSPNLSDSANEKPNLPLSPDVTFPPPKHPPERPQ
jgi:hypothetical protein